MRVYDLQAETLTPSDLFEFSDVRIADPTIRHALERSLRRFVGARRGRSQRVFQAGGFAVAPRYRGSALAPVLALAANAWFETLGLDGGLTFATLANNAAALFQRTAAYPMCSDGVELPTFWCSHHGAYGKLLTIEPGRYEPRWAETVAALTKRFADAKVLTPV